MSVYTRVARHELEMLLANYAIGALVQYRGISDGVINSNFFVDTSAGHYVLTLFETLDSAAVSAYLALMDFFAAQAMPVPMPVSNRYGAVVSELNGKPAVLVQRLPGASVVTPTISQCENLGTVLGSLHKLGRGYPHQLPDSHGRRWQRATAAQLLPHLPPVDAELIQQELEFQNLYRLSDLPCGIVHADLFRDNVLYQSDEVSGVLDWYSACTKALLYDVAVVANDWCCDGQGRLQAELTLALLQAYHVQRPLTAIERGAWPVLLRAAALRFWLSRLQAKQFPRSGETIHYKEPAHFNQILQDRITRHDAFYALWVA